MWADDYTSAIQHIGKRKKVLSAPQPTLLKIKLIILHAVVL